MDSTSESEFVSAVSPETNRRQAGDMSLVSAPYKGGDGDNRRDGKIDQADQICRQSRQRETNRNMNRIPPQTSNAQVEVTKGDQTYRFERPVEVEVSGQESGPIVVSFNMGDVKVRATFRVLEAVERLAYPVIDTYDGIDHGFAKR